MPRPVFRELTTMRIVIGIKVPPPAISVPGAQSTRTYHKDDHLGLGTTFGTIASSGCIMNFCVKGCKRDTLNNNMNHAKKEEAHSGRKDASSKMH